MKTTTVYRGPGYPVDPRKELERMEFQNFSCVMKYQKPKRLRAHYQKVVYPKGTIIITNFSGSCDEGINVEKSYVLMSTTSTTIPPDGTVFIQNISEL